jgi:hypothetical protein
MTYSHTHITLSTVDKRDKRRGCSPSDASVVDDRLKSQGARLSRLSTVYGGKCVVAWGVPVATVNPTSYAVTSACNFQRNRVTPPIFFRFSVDFPQHG